MRAALVAVGVIACGGSTSEPARPADPSPPVVAAPPDAAVVATPLPPAPAPVPAPPPAPAPAPAPAPPPVATLEGLVVAGELDAAKVSELLAPLAPQFAQCLGSAGPTTTELSLAIEKSAIFLREAWQGDGVVASACLRAMFPGESDRNTRQTTVYIVVKAGPPGAPTPAAPALAERRAEFVRLFCDLEQLSGADKVTGPDKQKQMIAWARAHVKHPAPLQVASEVPTWSPQDRVYNLTRAIKAEGIKTCRLQRW